MKAPTDAVIFYDADCPLCRVYTGAFVRAKLLDKEGRVPFQNVPASMMAQLDPHRAQDEIALLQPGTGRVRYGLDSLFYILGKRFPAVPAVGNFPPVRWLLERLYRFISYNRKVIAAVPPGAGLRTCQPSFSLRYRALYLVFAWITTAAVLYRYSYLLEGLIPPGGFWREAAIAGGQMIFQLAFLRLWGVRKRWDYLGHLMTVSLIGALLLLPVLALSSLIGNFPLLYAGYFMAVAGFMLLEHMRRVKLLGVTLRMSATWVLYRALVLAVLVYG